MPTSLEFQHLKDQHYLNDLKRFQSKHYLGQEFISAPISVSDISANFTFFSMYCAAMKKRSSHLFVTIQWCLILGALKSWGGREESLYPFLNIFSTWNLDNSHCQCMLISLALHPPFFTDNITLISKNGNTKLLLCY